MRLSGEGLRETLNSVQKRNFVLGIPSKNAEQILSLEKLANVKVIFDSVVLRLLCGSNRIFGGGGGVNGASLCGLQAGAQLSRVVCKMCKETLEKNVTTFFS